MKSAARAISAFMVFIILAALPFNAFAIDYLYHSPTIDLSDNLSDSNQFSWFPSDPNVVISQYNRGGTSDIGVRIQNANGLSVFGYTDLSYIVPGYTYIISFDSWNYQDRMDAQLFVSNDNIINDGTFSSNIFSPISLTFEPGIGSPGYNRYNYSFSLPTNNFGNGIGYLGMSLQCYSSNCYLVIKNVEIICLDQVISLALRSLSNDFDSYTEYMTSIVEDIKDYMFSLLYENNNNFGELLTNFFTWVVWWQKYNPEHEHSEFWLKYGDAFSVKLYELLNDALLGSVEEYTTDPAVDSQISEYNELESQLMQDKSADMSAALGEGQAALTNNNALAWIKYVMESTIFYNSKVTTYVIFALGMGLVVLTLGRKIKV